ncbi:hypothetical protein C7S16_6546 [Burkholderia thailandensis]|uniref:Uncharacterized protein n=1 Tax=Burkholderia thailandensis TaxID=57975 RepID=A0AAW9CVZ6_BURTH|nr:hypothetical protein [Burkholderia thailandensis]MDW9251921.1 hypothetical protein [Burkholderia thailandensis]
MRNHAIANRTITRERYRTPRRRARRIRLVARRWSDDPRNVPGPMIQP